MQKQTNNWIKTWMALFLIAIISPIVMLIDISYISSRRIAYGEHTTHLLGFSDLALSSTSRWLRHPIHAEPSAAISDTTFGLDIEPAGSMISPPRTLWMDSQSTWTSHQ